MNGDGDLRERLERLGDLRERWQREQREALELSRELVPLAVEAGMSVAEIGKLGGMSRQVVWEFMPVDPRRQRARRLTEPTGTRGRNT